MSEYADIELPADARLVRASGFCSLCDSRFRDELAYEFRAPDMRAGVAFIESRHVRLPDKELAGNEATPQADGFGSRHNQL